MGTIAPPHRPARYGAWPALLLATILILPFLPFAASSARASLLDLQGQYANPVEESAATANQATYDALLDSNGGPCSARARRESGDCSGNVFRVFKSTRELVQTANELTGTGPTEFSLGVDLSGLGTALRWTAGEEFSAHDSLSSEFISSQLSGLASRLSALRGGASGFFLAGLPAGNANGLALAAPATAGMGASADSGSAGETYSPWGGFVTGNYGYGDKAATGNEDAFDFDGYEITAGLDYRFGEHWVAGALGGYTEREIDFEQVGNIVVDGGVESDGYSLMLFGLYYADTWYASAAAGYQDMGFDTDRAIKYPSLNPDVDSVNTRTLSSTSSTTWTASATLGYNFSPLPALGLEPYLKLEYADTRIDGFTERDVNNDGFELQVEDQDIPSLEGVAGARAQYTLTPSFGVITPFVSAEYHHQFEADPRRIDALYSGVRDRIDAGSASFSVTTDALDEQYLVLSVGVSAVLRGGRQRVADGDIHGGLQGFISYRTIEGLQYYSHDIISAGLRYEF